MMNFERNSDQKVKTICYARCAHEKDQEEQTQAETCRALTEALGYRLIENDGRSQQEKFLERVSIVPTAVLHGAVVAFRE